MQDIGLNYNSRLEIDITPQGAERTWAKLKKGFRNLAESLNEVLFQASYLGDGGWGSTEVTGGQYIVTLAGVRYYNDTAQDWLFSDDVMYKFGAARKTTLRITRQNEAILEWDITLANLMISGGEANQPEAISVVIHANGAPHILTEVYLIPLTVVSVPGAEPGGTSIFVNPLLEDGNSYKYRVGASVGLPAFDAVLTTGWAAWNGASDIMADTGQQIVIAEVDGDNKAKKGGRAVVIANEEE